TSVMLPRTLPPLPARFHIRPIILTIDVPVDIGIAVDIDVDITTAPVASTPGVAPGRAQRHAGGKGQCRPGYIPPIPIERIGRVGGGGAGSHNTTRRRR